MQRFVLALAVTLAAGPAAASENSDVMATVHRFVDGFNKGDTATALATCAAPASIVDEFPPYAWQGATACSDWANDFDADAKKNGITDPVVTLGKPRHVNVTGDRAYVVVPADYKYKRNGKKVSEESARSSPSPYKSSRLDGASPAGPGRHTSAPRASSPRHSPAIAARPLEPTVDPGGCRWGGRALTNSRTDAAPPP